MASSSDLSIWMNGLRVGTWSVVRGVHSLNYDPAWVDSPAGRPLSLSLPFTLKNEPIRGARVAHYFDNLVPDADSIRNRLRSRFSSESTQAFDLLKVIGRDCVGAVQLMPDEEEPIGFDRIESETLSEGEVGGHRCEPIARACLGAYGGIRFSDLVRRCAGKDRSSLPQRALA